MKYTTMKLSDAALQRLSQLVNNKPKHGHGVALDALVRRRLAEEIPGAQYPKTHRATALGVFMLRQARREGW